MPNVQGEGVTPQQRHDMNLLLKIIHNSNGKWITAKEIRQVAHGQAKASGSWHRRYIAELADLASGRIISTTHGYKIQDQATDKEIMESYHQLTDKAERTGKRASAIMAYYHNHRLRPAKETDTAADPGTPVQQTLI